MVDSIVKTATSRLTYEMTEVSPELSWFLQMEFQRAEMPGPAGPGQRKTLNPAHVPFQVTDQSSKNFPERK